MEFNRNENPLYPQDFRIDFDPDESNVLGAAFREDLNLNIQNGGAERATTFEIALATWPEDQEKVIYVSNVIFITAKLREFASRTSDQAKELVVGGMQSYFDNRDAARRILLGRQATKLANDLDLIGLGQVEEEPKIQKQLNKPK